MKERECIKLVGMVGDEHHATGFVCANKLRTCGNIVRNGHHYSFSGRFSAEGFPIFAETSQPWDITGQFEKVKE